jgi:hexosaminidase
MLWGLLPVAGVLILMLGACRATGPSTHNGTQSKADRPALLPAPKHMANEPGRTPLPDTLACTTTDASLDSLIEAFDYEYRMLTGGRVVAASPDARTRCHLDVDTTLDEQAYRLNVDSTVTVTGGSAQAVAFGTVTVSQAIDITNGAPTLPRFTTEDAPDASYRGLLVDVAREWHGVSVLKQLVLLCRWYKINYLQLHLTDDPSFTFPTEAYPELPTPGRHYTKQELRALDRFARRHGVTLVPELDVPGHARVFTQQMPDLFGVQGRPDGNTINMGRDSVYQALDQILNEISDVFQTSPYIHIGGDEANLDGLADDPAVQQYMAAHDLPDVDELYRHFLVRMRDLVRKHGKQPIVWEGFEQGGDVEIPRDVIVMAWETLYQTPQNLLADGYTLINVSWKPLYVVNERKWDPSYIYHWNMYRWENWRSDAPSYDPIQLRPTEQVMGASMAAWAQSAYLELPTLRKRLPAMAERTWNATMEPERSEAWFQETLTRTDAAFQEVLSPVCIETDGLRYPTLEDGHDNEQFWFDDTLIVSLEADSNQVVHYTLDGQRPTLNDRRYTEPIRLRESASLRARAFSADGRPVGYARWRHYSFHPLNVDVEGSLETPLSELWSTRRSWEADFSGTITIRISSGRDGTIHYTTDGTSPSVDDPSYNGPITISETATVKAQLFDDGGQPLGHPWNQHFRKIKNESASH